MPFWDWLARYFFSLPLAKSGVLDGGVQVIHRQVPLSFGSRYFFLGNGSAINSVRG
jgi:hypothetical protein